jgi:hypothetical protein
MMWELALAARDEADLPSGHKRKKQGDIIAAKPHPWSWGTIERKEYLIVVVDGLSEQEVAEMQIPYYQDGKKPKDFVIDEATGFAVIPPTVGKRRFQIPFDVLKQGWKPDLDVSMVEDFGQEYQPMKEIIIDFSEKVSICKDKHLGTFRYSTKKVL